jgi:transposase
MAKGYRPVRRDQPFLLPPDMREWLPAAHPVWLVIAAVAGHLDTAAFHARRRTGGPGTAGYDPDMLVTLLVWAYSQGVTSSRRIEAACWTDVSFRVICAGDVPDHATVSRFRGSFPGAVEDLFTSVLVLCARLGMGQLGTVALDGMKIAASASKAANRTEEGLRKLAAQRVAEHAEADAADDAAEHQAAAGGRVPPPGGPGRDERIAAALAQITAERQAAGRQEQERGQAYLAAQAAGRPGPPPAAAAVTAAQARLDRARAARAAQLAELDRRAAGPALRGRRRDRPRTGAEDYCLVTAARQALEKARARQAETQRKAAASPRREPVRNITDPDSRLMPTRSGFIQGYNAQNVTSADGLIIATQLTRDTTDTPWFTPMLRHAGDAAALITRHHPAPATPDTPDSGIGLMLADAGYLSAANLTTAGPDRLIATGTRRDLEKTARHATPPGSSQDPPDPQEDPIAAMTARLATDEGITAYRQRSHIAETPHGNIKHNKRFRQLTLRGLPKASAEWQFAAAIHNLFKTISTGHLTPDALTALAS